MTPICNQMLVPYNPLVCMVIEVGSNNYGAYTFGIVNSEYQRILQITSIISNLHKMGGK
jgi:hypothetical protein